MSALDPPTTRRDRVRESAETLFWLAIITLFGFFVVGFVFGVVDPGQMPLVVVLTIVLAAIGVARMRYDRRHHSEMEHDPRVRHARERRGF